MWLATFLTQHSWWPFPVALPSATALVAPLCRDHGSRGVSLARQVLVVAHLGAAVLGTCDACHYLCHTQMPRENQSFVA